MMKENKVKAISAELLELNLKNNLEDTGRTRTKWEETRRTKKNREETGRMGIKFSHILDNYSHI